MLMFVQLSFKKLVDVLRLTENHVIPCSQLSITSITMVKPHYLHDSNCTWCCWDPSWPLYWIMIVLLMVDTNQLNEESCHQVICTMATKYAKLQTTYAFLYGVGTKLRLEAIKKHYLQHEMETRVHKNIQRLPYNALSFDEITSVIKFIENYAEQHAILLPGRIPAYKRDDMKLLPSSTSKKVQ